MADQPLIVVALGGNAISKPHEEGNVVEQFANSEATARQLADLVEGGYRLVITHGNGPQIGNFLLRNRAAANAIYPLPMEVAVAHVQGGMGYMIGQTLANELARRGQQRTVTTIITSVVVERGDPDFSNPTKPIGRTLSAEQAKEQECKDGWKFAEVSEGKFRRLVASPLPKRILELNSIRRAVDAGELLIACGGGGIPVFCDEGGVLEGTRAVIDKDLASALLASELDAQAMLILTAVDRVSINFGTPDETPIERMTLSEAEGYMREGQFPSGSMGPKIQAAINFLEQSKHADARVVIGSLTQACDALAGRVGTTICVR